MVASAHGVEVTHAAAAEACQPGRDGLSALSLIRSAQMFGMRGRGLRVDLDALVRVELPVILHWGFNHFVVLEKWNGKVGTLVDPGAGRRRIKREELDAKFTGVVVALEPSATLGAQVSPTNDRPWRRHLLAAWRARGVRSKTFQVLMVSLLLAVAGLGVPITTRLLVNEILPLYDSGPIVALISAALILLVGYAVLSLLRGFLLIWLQGKVSSQLVLGFYEHILSLPFRFFQQRGSGDLMVRLTSNIALQNILTQGAIAAVLDVVLIVTYAIIMLIWSWQFGLLALALGTCLLTITLLAVRPAHHLMQRDLEAQSMSEGFLVESLTGIETLKATGSEQNALARWSDLFFAQLNLSLRRGRLDALVTAFTGALLTLAPLILLLAGGLLVISQQLTLGSALALQGLAVLFLAPLGRIVAQIQQIQLAAAHLGRIGDVMGATPEADEFGREIVNSFSGRIEMRDVAFRFSPTDADVIQDINVVIEPGSTVALVGASGSGKSTFAKLVLGLLRPTAGDVLYDGRSQSSLDIRSLRSHFGAVIQSTSVFAGSVRSNIAFANPNMPFEEVVRAASMAALHNDVAAMPLKYETIISESGTVLSGGQRQRLALARCFASRPAALILDEATSHLDAVTEATVMESLRGMPGTKIICAHRLSTVTDADLILVFDRGRIVQRGRHDEMVAVPGPYLDLVRRQMPTEDPTNTADDPAASPAGENARG